MEPSVCGFPPCPFSSWTIWLWTQPGRRRRWSRSIPPFSRRYWRECQPRAPVPCQCNCWSRASCPQQVRAPACRKSMEEQPWLGNNPLPPPPTSFGSSNRVKPSSLPVRDGSHWGGSWVEERGALPPPLPVVPGWPGKANRPGYPPQGCSLGAGCRFPLESECPLRVTGSPGVSNSEQEGVFPLLLARSSFDMLGKVTPATFRS